MILCSHKRDVDKYNNILIHKIFQPHEIFKIIVETNVIGIEIVRNWLNDLKFNHINYIAIGAKVMITKNINISKGAINGTIAIVTIFTFNDNNMIASIIIKFISTNMYITLNRQTLQHKYTYESYYYKASFPIALAYAIIGHKA
jgi:hypothetical protein